MQIVWNIPTYKSNIFIFPKKDYKQKSSDNHCNQLTTFYKNNYMTQLL